MYRGEVVAVKELDIGPSSPEAQLAFVTVSARAGGRPYWPAAAALPACLVVPLARARPQPAAADRPHLAFDFLPARRLLSSSPARFLPPRG